MKTERIALRPANTLESVLSLPCVVSSLRAAHPDAEIGAVVDIGFREAAHLIPGLDFVSTSVEGADYKTFDLRSESIAFAESAEWKAYALGCTKLGRTNPYHQVDLWKKLARVDEIDSNFELLPADVTTKGLPESIYDTSAVRLIVCANSLGIDELQALFDGLSRATFAFRIFLLGTVPQKRKAAVLLSMWQDVLPIEDLCGRLTFSETAEAFRVGDIAITGPGASAILSSGYGTFTVCVDADANPHHYPYGHGHLVVQPTSREQTLPLSAILQEITHFAVTGNGGTLPSLEQWQEFADAQIDNYLGRIRLFATQRVEMVVEEGGSFTELYLRPLIYLGADVDDTSRSFYRLLWEHHLQGRTLTTNDLSLLQEDTVAALCDGLKPLQQLYELANFGRVYCGHVKKALIARDLDKARQDSARVQEVENLLHQLAESQAFLAPLCSFHSRHQALLPDLDALDMARRMEELFLSLQSRVTVLLDLSSSLFHTTLHNESQKEYTPEPVTGGGETFHG